jgi:hypothetical protein
MARRRWSRPPTQRTAPAQHPSPPGCTPEDQVRRLTCALCSRETRGFAYVHQLRWNDMPRYRFCSMACCEAGGALAQRGGGVIDKSVMEERAIKEARRPLAEVLTELNLMAPFHDRTAADIDRIIEACVDGFQASMHRQAGERDPMNDPVPF